jgi:hypothetical protein
MGVGCDVDGLVDDLGRGAGSEPNIRSQSSLPVIFESEPELALDPVLLLRQILDPKELILTVNRLQTTYVLCEICVKV